jgi:hypothetical protein
MENKSKARYQTQNEIDELYQNQVSLNQKLTKICNIHRFKV